MTAPHVPLERPSPVWGIGPANPPVNQFRRTAWQAREPRAQCLNQRRFLTAAVMDVVGGNRTARQRILGTGAAPRIDLAARAAILAAKRSPCHCLKPPPVIARKARLKSPACGYRYGHAISRVLVPGRADAYK